MSRRLLAAATTAALALTMTAGISTGAVAASSDDPPTPPPAPDVAQLEQGAKAADKISPDLAKASGPVTVFVELDATSGVDTAEAGGSSAAVEAAADQVERIADDVVPAASTARSADPVEKIAVTTDLVPGIVVHGDAAALRALAAKPQVTSIRVMTPKVPMNSGTDVFTKAMAAWESTGFTGKDVTIGVIDTGLDYTHADFGGPGTTAAYAEAYGTDGTGPVPDGLYDPAKFLGGWDFAGPTYDAAGSGDQLVPHPDANPIDSPEGSTPGSSHGSHVAGTAAGYGVLDDGSTFSGDYGSLTDLSGFKIGPGSAPQAGIYALKVFGDEVGSTNLTLQALEWAADPNNDGDYSDHLDIVNMSLGSDYGPADDPENDFIDQLTKLGVLSVVASGNASDVVDVGGTPGNAASSLTVANSVGDTFLYDGVDVTEAPTAATGLYGAQNTIAYGGADVTAPVVYLGDDVDGCTAADGSNPLDSYDVAGKIVWLLWREPGFRCGSVQRWTNAANAGAAGAIVGWGGPVFTYGLTGSSAIPGAMLTAKATDALLPDIKAGGVVMTIGPGLAGTVSETNPAAGDLVNDSSSRGVHGSLGIVKPDVAAPGTSISSVAASTGDGRTTKSGTSMATPHVAGIAALVRQAHPRWTAQQVKAAVMNTATHDLYLDPAQSGPVYGPERVGSGRVDALSAVTDDVIAYNTDNPQLVSVTFGVVGVGDKTVVRKAKVTVRNMGKTTHKFDASFAQATSAGGATITVSPSSFTLRPGQKRVVTVTLTADPSSLAKEIDPTSSPDSGVGVPREFVTTISGRLVLADRAGGELRVPVQAAPRLVSDMSARPLSFDGDTAALSLTGSDALSGGWYSLAAPMVLAATSPVLPDDASVGVSPSTIASGDLRYVGYASSAPQLAAAGTAPTDGSAYGTIGIGIATQGEWTSLGALMFPIIDTDVDNDGTPDFETIVWKYTADVDLTTVETYQLVPSGGGLALGDLVDLDVVNGITADFQTTVFDNNVLVAPISLEAMGVTPGMTPTFSVQTYSPLTEDLIDTVEPFTVDPYAPPYWFDTGFLPLWAVDTPGDSVVVHRSADAGDAKVLLLHALNDKDSRAEVVSVVEPAPVRMHVWMPWFTTDRWTTPVGVSLSSTAPPSGTVEISEGDTVLATAEVTTRGNHGVAHLRLPKLSAGVHHLTVSYSGNAAVESATVTKQLWVARAGH